MVWKGTEDMIDVEEAAEMLGFHTNTVYRLAKARDLPSVKVRGRVLFERDAIDAWIRGSIDRRGNDSTAG